jgi:hypothetical protein
MQSCSRCWLLANSRYDGLVPALRCEAMDMKHVTIIDAEFLVCDTTV